MPVVEPYAISEPLSTAGKINMNYQMLPFTHIRRATAMHAVMKGEIFAALPNAEYGRARGLRADFTSQGAQAPRFHEEIGDSRLPNAASFAARWHRSIAIDRTGSPNGVAEAPWWQQALSDRVHGTLRQFEERFNFGGGTVSTGPSGVGASTLNGGLLSTFRSGLFRSASQICEVHLIPSPVPTTGNVPAASSDDTENVASSFLNSATGREAQMTKFWRNHAATGDNAREAPYSNLYAKLTTRSNTFRVHVRVQSLRKATRGSKPEGWVPGEDEVTGEYRGSYLLERYIDRSDLNAAGSEVDFTIAPLSKQPLDSYYRFRVLETKRFSP